MSSKFRKMIGKRSTKNAPPDPADMDDQAATENSSSSPITLVKKKEEPIAQDDLSDVPPPPAAKLKANHDTSRKVSPSKTLLERYKSRSASSHTSSPPTIKIPATTPPRNDSESESPKGTKYNADDFNDQTPPLATDEGADNAKGKGKGKAPADAAATSSDNTRIRFKLPGGTGDDDEEMKRFRNSENNSPGKREERPEKRRATRSFTRRTERADSHARGSINSVIANALADVSLYSPVEVPPGLTIRKAEASRTPSPASTSPQLASPKPKSPLSATDEPTPPKETESPKPQPATPTDRPSTPPQSQPDSPPIPPKSPRRSEAQKPKDEEAKATSASSPPTPRAKDFASTPDEQKLSPVAVRPPIYDSYKTPSQQWESDVGSSSRPHGAWMHTKRWTCCSCQGMTIVEQTVCSRMTCKHDRCPTKCRLERHDRMKGPFQN